jgi:hypothetical protein
VTTVSITLEFVLKVKQILIIALRKQGFCLQSKEATGGSDRHKALLETSQTLGR